MFTLLCGGNELKPFIDNPFDSTIKLFFLFDSVHLLKCIRNNWVNQADTSQTFTYPDLDNKTLIHRACFADLKKMHSFVEGFTADAIIPEAYAEVVSDSCDGCIDDRDLTCFYCWLYCT